MSFRNLKNSWTAPEFSSLATKPASHQGIGWMKRVPAYMVLQLLRAYKFAVSPWFGVACRYRPTCSEYAMQAIELHGVLRGGAMAAGRLLRCHPLGASGYDPVQESTSNADFASTALRFLSPIPKKEMTE